MRVVLVSVRFVVFLLLASAASALAQSGRIELVHTESAKRVDVLVDGKPFTAYIYPGPDVLKKAVLYPIRSAGGNFITRGWPLDPRPGERVDHPHHVGMWFNYGDVNGHDFWNNSTAIEPGHKGPFGTIVHTGISAMKNGAGASPAELTVTANWLDKDGKVMLQETTTFRFGAGPDRRIIDRITTLKAASKDVVFKDNKEGMIALRMARQLEQPSNKPEVFTDSKGVTTNVPTMNNEGVTGQYQSSIGTTGDAVWGTRAPWMNLTGRLNNERVSVILIDHPQNVGYPTYWHARGYGLYAANPLGPAVFSNGKEQAMNYTLAAGKEVTFRYRLLVQSGSTNTQQIAAEVQQFATKNKN
ncbi:PmoA family protein [Spirosoma montaniterrae]|uniref:Methane oxygenase PmoA n=1 Tax=Spirosoma montaniterrae TaxID=1178516 RepID=A0A1P9WWK3_9BACT|nr:PmoA family protein [Spirosoma montaniterrae]AQG79698.1 hypothetical protein AWR27_10385 [Spirosoma montaniterrae]